MIIFSIRKFDFSACYDRLFWPYHKYERFDSAEEARYFGTKWFLLLHVLWWEIVISESV